MKSAVRLLIAGALMSVGGVSLADSTAGGNDGALALNILKNLEVNTFRNSLRPAHYPDGTTLGQTPYRVYEKDTKREGAYSAVDADRSWIYSVRVMERGDKAITICFVDHNLRGSYLFASPLLVETNRAGHYVVVKELPKTPACGITRG
ncbi:pesticin immunity protein [Pseudomonas chlororaphis]|uniref:Pesticin immunity protein n=1 Tax=Pseudomonas chlororaphis TaxID=587753 RepID=A0AB34CC04_9PSED|nr:pesticin immunity protein [Pseudomonas chlororaphis]KAA5845330.1 pesticin immunity protein [Pseudomonas chlororaphis]